MSEQSERVRRTHNQIANALKKEARLRGIDVNNAYNQFLREVFLKIGVARKWWTRSGAT